MQLNLCVKLYSSQKFRDLHIVYNLITFVKEMLVYHSCQVVSHCYWISQLDCILVLLS